MYSPAAQQLRRCTATTRAGRPCAAWAMWSSGPDQLCARHAGRLDGPRTTRRYGHHQHAHYTPCTCHAHPFPHRPGSHPCAWPDTPQDGQSKHSESRKDARAVADAGAVVVEPCAAVDVDLDSARAAWVAERRARLELADEDQVEDVEIPPRAPRRLAFGSVGRSML